MRMKLPENVEYIIEKLQGAGFEAYAVGGCVRDCLLQKEPKDWDVTTSADPVQVKSLFRRTVDTGIKHGTVTVLLNDSGYEVTTYRLDGEYEDARHPKEVVFTKSLQEDLKRRDFTINAMAYNHRDGLVDLFGGESDLKQGLIRCVGVPRERFDEDALRMLRALRFSAQLGFHIEQATEAAIRERASQLRKISVERIRDELNKLLLSPSPERMLAVQQNGIIDIVLPPLSGLLSDEKVATASLLGIRDYARKEYDYHTQLILCWGTILNAALLYRGTTGSVERREAVRSILRGLKFDNDTINKASGIAEYSSDQIPLTPIAVRKQMSRMGEELFFLWLAFLGGVRFADGSRFPTEKLEQIKQMVEEICSKPYCISLKDLAVNGGDLIAAGNRQGLTIGETLQYLLEQVLEHPEWNRKDILLALAKEYHQGITE